MFHRLKYFQGLETKALKQLSENMIWADLPVGNLSVFNEDGISEFIYFPVTAICALEAIVDEGVTQLTIFGSNTVVGSAIGNDGFRPKGLRTSVIVAGLAGRMRTEVFNILRDRYPSIDTRMLKLAMRFTWAIAADSACGGRHTAMQRVAEKIAKVDLLRRGAPFKASASAIAAWSICSRSTSHSILSSLKESGAIEFDNDQVIVADRDALHAVACGCSRQWPNDDAPQLEFPINEGDNVVFFRPETEETP